MPNINRQITLTSKGTNSGPLYDVFYSLDCINYTLCIDGSNVSLPSIGSTAIVTLPDNTACLKLVNLTIGCGNNSEIQIITPTTTTTTTAAPTTTTTTTTSTTTTTTTTAPTANLSYSYTKSSPAGYMDIIVNDIIIDTLNSTGTGNYNVVQGDVIRAVIQTSGCTSPDIKANAYTFGIIADAACTDNAASLSTAGYTVTSGNIGNTINLSGYSSCDGACI